MVEVAIEPIVCPGETVERYPFRDLFGRSLKVTEINDADPIASVAVMLMGESAESTPMAIIHVPFLEYRLGGQPSEIPTIWQIS